MQILLGFNIQEFFFKINKELNNFMLDWKVSYYKGKDKNESP